MKESIDPEIRALMEAWDRRTGNTSNRTPSGPLSADHRAKIGDALRVQVEKVPCPDGEPMPVEVRRRIGDTLRNKSRKQSR